jgi:hypothetical protein
LVGDVFVVRLIKKFKKHTTPFSHLVDLGVDIEVYDGSARSVHRIIRKHLEGEEIPTPLSIQSEMLDEKMPLEITSAGLELTRNFNRLARHLRGMIDERQWRLNQVSREEYNQICEEIRGLEKRIQDARDREKAKMDRWNVASSTDSDSWRNKKKIKTLLSHLPRWNGDFKMPQVMDRLDGNSSRRQGEQNEAEIEASRSKKGKRRSHKGNQERVVPAGRPTMNNWYDEEEPSHDMQEPFSTPGLVPSSIDDHMHDQYSAPDVDNGMHDQYPARDIDNSMHDQYHGTDMDDSMHHHYSDAINNSSMYDQYSDNNGMHNRYPATANNDSRHYQNPEETWNRQQQPYQHAPRPYSPLNRSMHPPAGYASTGFR